jgi:hypothetical protein
MCVQVLLVENFDKLNSLRMPFEPNRILKLGFIRARVKLLNFLMCDQS